MKIRVSYIDEGFCYCNIEKEFENDEFEISKCKSEEQFKNKIFQFILKYASSDIQKTYEFGIIREVFCPNPDRLFDISRFELVYPESDGGIEDKYFAIYTKFLTSCHEIDGLAVFAEVTFEDKDSLYELDVRTGERHRRLTSKEMEQEIWFENFSDWD